MQKKFRRLAAAILCLTLLAVPALAAEATIDLDYVTIVGEGFVADTFCGVDALYNETGATLFCNELIERFYSAVYGVDVYTDNGNITAASPAGYCQIRRRSRRHRHPLRAELGLGRQGGRKPPDPI